ncbi:MAG TPA: hypothetical protein VF603_07155 [Allosphingosinicella sp.]|jgi:hypothetical protein
MIDRLLIVEIIFSLTVPIAIVGVLWARVRRDKGLGVRSMQFLTVSVAFPTLAVLAFEEVLDGDAVSALIGALLGYLLSTVTQKRTGGKDKGDERTE